MGWLERYRDRKDAEWWERHRRATRWNDLGRYNSELQRGIVHTPEWDAKMAVAQRAFNEAHGHPTGSNVFPFAVDPA